MMRAISSEHRPRRACYDRRRTGNAAPVATYVDTTGAVVESMHERISELELQHDADQEKIANLEIALLTARRIGAAIGILMAQNRWTDEQAFEALRSASQNRHLKLRDLAEDVI